MNCWRIENLIAPFLDDELPDLTPVLDAVGDPRPLAMAKHLLTRPRVAAQLPTMASAFGLAQARLKRVVTAGLAWADRPA